eukprot:1156894-Pelagomonas_calceolata.AAC.10
MYTHTHIYTSLGGVTCSCRLHGFAPGGPVSGDHRHMQRTLSLTYDDLGNLARTIAGSRNANSVDVIGDAVTNIMNPQGKEQEHLHTGGSEKSSQGAAAARDEVSNRASCCRYTADVEQKRCKMEGRKMGMVGAGVNYGAKEQEEKERSCASTMLRAGSMPPVAATTVDLARCVYVFGTHTA